MLGLIHLLFFYFFVLSFSAVAHAEEAACLLQEPNHTVSVGHINDGDTFTLKDNKRVRIIGINTPELGYEAKPDQPLAIQARDSLRMYLRDGRALLVYDENDRDKYGRILAHVFDTRRNNVTAALLREGLGFIVSIPPNLRYRDCYLDAQRQARRAKRGVWAEPYFQPIAANQLKHNGFNIVQGCIQRTRKYRDVRYFYLSDNFRLLVPEDNEHYFKAASIVLEKELCLVAMGWVYKHHAYRTMKLLHPDAAQVIRPVFKDNEW